MADSLNCDYGEDQSIRHIVDKYPRTEVERGLETPKIRTKSDQVNK